MAIKTKSVLSPAEANDGLRILVARFRGRGLSTNRYHVWMPSLGPSEQLLRSFQSGKISWAVFSKLYKKELFSDAAIDSKNNTIKNHGQKFTLRMIKQLSEQMNITLMCHCKEEEKHCHRHLLFNTIKSKKV